MRLQFQRGDLLQNTLTTPVIIREGKFTLSLGREVLWVELTLDRTEWRLFILVLLILRVSLYTFWYY
jgi:hypothetical protein